MKPCPVCGDAARMRHHAVHDDEFSVEFYVSCCRCGLRTRNWRTEEQAVMFWDTRTVPPSEALSFEQLAKMDGQPVWAQYNDGSGGHYGIVENGEFGLHVIIDDDTCYWASSGGWTAYSHKPE